MPIKSIGYAKDTPNGPFHLWNYEIRDPKPHDVLIEVAFCGICHTDLHISGDEYFGAMYPMVPGRELTGVVIQVGGEVTKLKKGDRVGVGRLVGSCGECSSCKEGVEQYCPKAELTYTHKYDDGEITYGGYGKYVVCNEKFAVPIPDDLPLDRAAPLFCGGITGYSALSLVGAKKGGLKIGVIGFGGLGHLTVLFAKAMGNEVVVVSRSNAKRSLAEGLGASQFLVSEEDYKANAESLDIVMDTVAVKKPVGKYMSLLKRDGTYVLLGAAGIGQTEELPVFSLIMKRRKMIGSLTGGVNEIQQMLQYAAEHKILPLIEMITGDQLDEAHERVNKGDVKFRFVIDVKKTYDGLTN